MKEQRVKINRKTSKSYSTAKKKEFVTGHSKFGTVVPLAFYPRTPNFNLSRSHY